MLERYKLGDYHKPEEICECMRCKEESTIREWDNNTLDNVEPENRKLFTSLTRKEAYDKVNRMWYLCPKCNDWSIGYVIEPKRNK